MQTGFEDERKYGSNWTIWKEEADNSQYVKYRHKSST